MTTLRDVDGPKRRCFSVVWYSSTKNDMMLIISDTQRKWRDDGMCGYRNPLPNGKAAQCNPDGENPCCSSAWNGRCGNTARHCSCSTCADYKFAKWWRESGGTQMWRNDGKCGDYYRLPNGTAAQCNPDGENPCCNRRYGECGNTTEHCSCWDCTDYKFAKWWRESGGTQMWRNDGKCGIMYLLPNGTASECDPDGENPCCSNRNWNGECGNTTEHCSCIDCTDYKYEKLWRESGGTLMWRHDGKCGFKYPLRNGTAAQCNPDGENPCCNGGYGECGKSREHCFCDGCTDYKFEKLWRESGGTLMWRNDGKCGSGYPLPNGTAAQCDPDGENPCCSSGEYGRCGNTREYCSCRYCTDFKMLYKDWRESGGTLMWRNDGKCGSGYPLPNGTAAQCDPDGENPCCSDRYRECGNTAEHCSCQRCKDYKFAKLWRESGGTQMWRNDGMCGSGYPLPNGTAAQCNPDGENPCCNGRYGECGNTAEHCSCWDCTDYKFVKLWRESGGTLMWRNDGKCGSDYPLPNGTAAQCDPDGENPCCNRLWNGRCGKSAEHCFCDGCTDYKFEKLWRESGGTLMWRNDGKCGSGYPLPNGTAAQCDPDGENPCCSSGEYGRCGNSREYCSCRYCTDFKMLYKEWRESGGTLMWRNDGKCGSGYPLPNGTAAQCDPDGENPCCSGSWHGECGNTTEHCSCRYCTDYKFAKLWRESGGTQMWRNDGKCGSYYSLPNGTAAQCNPDGENPCCSGSWDGVCGNTTKHCSCRFCTDFNMLYKEWRESGGTHMWRYDGKCGDYYILPNGKAAQCNPDGENPCCRYGQCGNTANYCSCRYCTNYKFAKLWRESGGTQMWRNDGMCGSGYPLPNGTAAQCNPDGENPCCSNIGSNGIDWRAYECGYSTERCSCKDCTDYRKIKWRNDGRCGSDFPLTDGTLSQCDPLGQKPCCTDGGYCSSGQRNCSCKDCVNYIQKRWRRDRRCGSDYPLPDGTSSQCDPDGEKPCCGRDGRCGAGMFYCSCNDCVSYERKRWRSDGKCGGPLPFLNGKSYSTRDGDIAECNPFGEYPICNKDDGYCVKDCSGENCVDYKLSTKNMENRSCYQNYTAESTSGIASFRDYKQNNFKCDNGECVNFNQLCDRIDDCGDLSDELDCPNHMICNSTKSGNPKFVHVSKVCDGRSDCFDMSDECNNSCGKEILGSWVLKITCCFMGLLAIVFNSVSLFHGLSSTINDCPTEKVMITKVLMSLIGSGDFLIGIYLIVLSIYDSLVYRSSYCVNQAEWLTGTPCMILGVISTVGSQLSLFSMTTLSCIMMYGFVFQKMTIPSPVSRKSKIKATFLAFMLLTVSLVIAVTPLIPILEDFFVESVYYGSDIRLLTGFPGKKWHINLIREGHERWEFHDFYFGTWRKIRSITDSLFRHHGDLRRRPVHFYGNDGICLFKYFVRRDSEFYFRAENFAEDEYTAVTRNLAVWTMLIVNSVCLFIIMICYIAITCKTRMSTQESGQSDNPDRLRENKALQNRIILIIVTDFLCWVPFITVSGMHNLECIDASKWYTPFAMTLLPINSVINPLMYDKILLEFLKRKFRKAGEYVTVRLGHISIRAALNRLCWRREENAPPENEIPMEVINH